MDTQFQHKYSDVLCSTIFGSTLQLILRRVRPMSAQLEILAIDRTTNSIRNTIHTMMFEGVSKDDVNYHMLVYYKADATSADGSKKEVNMLYLIYPNGIICIYDNILQHSSQNHRKAHLLDIIQSDYENMVAPSIILDRLVFVSKPDLAGPAGNTASRTISSQQNNGPILVSIEMDKLEEEITQKKQMSNRDTCIVKIADHLANYASKKSTSQDASWLKISDINCSISETKGNKDILCFVSFNNGLIFQFSFRNDNRKNQVLNVYGQFGQTEIFQQALSEADLDIPEIPAPSQKSSAATEFSQHQQLCKITCLDFLQQATANNLGLLVVGDALGFVYLIQLSALEGQQDQLLYMSYANQSSHQEAKSIIASKWLSWLDMKFVIITADGDLVIFEVQVNREDELGDSIQVTKIHQIQTFEELNQTFQFSDINQLGSQSIQAFPDSSSRPGLLPDQISILWPNRILRKHDITAQSRRDPHSSAAGSQDKIITQSCLHQYSIVPTNYSLRVNNSSSNVVFCSALSSNGANFLHQMSMDQLIPSQFDDQLECPQEYEAIYYIDDQSPSVCMFSNITGKQSPLFCFKEFLGKTKSALFTDLQMRQNKNMIKFLISWADPRAATTDKKYLFTWISFDLEAAKIIPEQSNCDGPKFGLYVTFLVGVPSAVPSRTGRVAFHYDNLNESIVCLDHDVATQASSSTQTSKLRVFQFDPFLDTREINLQQRVQHVYATPLRSGKVVMFYNVSENLIQFSKNKSESKYQEDDFGLNRKYSFQLAYGERVVDIRWYNCHDYKIDGGSGTLGSKHGKASAAVSASQPLGSKSHQSQSPHAPPKAVIASNHRIYIVDKSLSIIQNFSLLQQKTYLIVRSLSVVAQTILFSTDHHLHYLTQEKQGVASGIVLSFNANSKQQSSGRSIVGALADRVMIAVKEEAFQVRFIIRQTNLLEPLLLGHLATISQSKIKAEIDLDLVQRACLHLDTNQVSHTLSSKLHQMGLLNSELFLYQNQNAQQFSITDHIPCISAKTKNQPDERSTYFEKLFPNKDITTTFESEADVKLSNLEDRNDVLIKMQNDPSYCCEKAILEEKLIAYKLKLSTNGQFDLPEVQFAFEVAELLNEWQFAISLLKYFHIGLLRKFLELLIAGNDQQRYKPLIQFIDLVLQDSPAPSHSIVEFENPRHQTWLSNMRSLFAAVVEEPTAPPRTIIDKPIQQRVKVAYNESAFSYSCQDKLMLTVVSHNMANWFGYDSIIVSEQPAMQPGPASVALNFNSKEDGIGSKEVEEDAINEDTKPEDIEEQKHVLFYFRCEEGSGNQIMDISDNNYKCEFGEMRETPWSQEKLEESQPLEYEDKWGKVNQPSYSIDLTTIQALQITPDFGLPQNFAFEFWLKYENNSNFQLDILTHFVVDFSTNALRFAGQNYKMIQSVPSPDTWVHIALVISTSRGVRLYFNTQLATPQIDIPKSGLSNKAISCLLSSSSQSYLDITELRFWTLALNGLILTENYKTPLSMLSEQKRKIKVQINKKKAGGGLPKLGGLSSGGLGQSKFKTNAPGVHKLAGLSKLDVRKEDTKPKALFATNMDFAGDNSFSQTMNPAADKRNDFFGFAAPAQEEQQQAPKFNFSNRENGANDVQFQEQKFVHHQLESQEIPVGQEPELNREIFAQNKPQSLKKGKPASLAKPRAPALPETKQEKIQIIPNSANQQALQELQRLNKEKQDADALKEINNQLTSILTAILTLDLDNSRMHSLFVKLTTQVFECHQKFQLLSFIELKEVLTLVASLRLISNLQQKIKSLEAEGTRESTVEIASLSSVFISQIFSINNLQNIEDHNSKSVLIFLTTTLQQKMGVFALISNLCAHEYSTAERILSFLNKEILPNDEISAATALAQQIIDESKQKTGGVSINNQEPKLKCPQCQSRLPFGHAQTSCNDCFAQLTLCSASLDIILNELGSFLSRCELCNSNFSKQWLERMKLVSDVQQQVKCPACMIEYIQL